METTATTTLFVESRHCFSIEAPHQYMVHELLSLSDGHSFISCSGDKTAKLWSITIDDDNDNNNSLRLVGTYSGHGGAVMCAVEIDSNTFATSSANRTLKQRRKTTHELCAGSGGVVEIRSANDLGLSTHSTFTLAQLVACRLDDGSFVEQDMANWSDNGTVLQACDLGERIFVKSVIELQHDRNVMLTWGPKIQIWNISEELCTMPVQVTDAWSLVKTSEDRFVIGGSSKFLQVYNVQGDNQIRT